MPKGIKRFSYQFIPYEDKVKRDLLLTIDGTNHYLNAKGVLRLRKLLETIYEEFDEY